MVRLLSYLLALALCLASLWVPAAEPQRNLSVAHADAPATERRVALVIGNSQYKNSPLKNATNDAADIAVALRGLSFEVIERKNLTTRQIGGALREFRSKLRPGDVALFFYAGHGLQIKGENYLPAVDAEIDSEEDVPNQSLSMRQLMEVMEDAKTRLNLVFLDACRNNPYARSFRSTDGGLAKLNAPSGTLISFATRPGSVAADGEGRNGLYTSHLLTALETPNQPVEQVLKRVTSSVRATSKGKQEPWMEGSIEGDFYFKRVAFSSTNEGIAALRERQEAIDRVEREATRRANEQSARERAELQVALERANEKAAREKAELQEKMQKMIEEALARQAAMQAANSEAPKPVKPTPPPELPPVPVVKPSPSLVRHEPEKPATPAIQTTQVEVSTPVKPIPTSEPLREPVVGLVANKPELPVSNPSPALARNEPEKSAKPPTPALKEPSIAVAVAVAAAPRPTPPTSPAVRIQAPEAVTPVIPAKNENSVVVAALSPVSPSASSTSAVKFDTRAEVGDEWVYTATEKLFEKKSTFTWRVVGVSSAAVLEQLYKGDRKITDWAFADKPNLIRAPVEMGFFFGPHWTGNQFSKIRVLGFDQAGFCASRTECVVSLKTTGKETISVPGGTFDSIRLDGVVEYVYNSSPGTTQSVPLTIWYSEKERRLIRQVAKSYSGNWYSPKFDEVIELQAVRKANAAAAER